MMYHAPQIVTHHGLADAASLLLVEVCEPNAKEGMDRRVDKLRVFIDRSDGQTGSNLDSLCHTLGLGISGAHAGRLFKRQFGVGVRAYATARRLMKAAHLLRTTNLCIKTISGNLGYHNTADFSRKFRQEFDVTPTEYRNQPFVA